MSPHTLDVTDEVAEPAITDADAERTLCEAGRGLTWIGPFCTRTLPYC